MPTPVYFEVGTKRVFACSLDGGAYASSSTAVTSNAASFAVGPYAVENALIESTCVYTNNPPCGAMRGFGAVQTCFAAEAQMDKLAAALGLDPADGAPDFEAFLERLHPDDRPIVAADMQHMARGESVGDVVFRTNPAQLTTPR